MLFPEEALCMRLYHLQGPDGYGELNPEDAFDNAEPAADFGYTRNEIGDEVCVSKSAKRHKLL